ncbi:hypothetical protein FS842_003942 [Serendipita sp. 407]|nr:hypothetical protein FS842_003942 [Serendipita sp. 407]
MVFATLSQRDKEAFFSLLDEYFESRPHLFAGSSAPRTTVAAPPSTTVTATNRTPSRPIPVPSVQHSPPASPPAIKPKSFVPAKPVPVPTRKVTPTPRIVEVRNGPPPLPPPNFLTRILVLILLFVLFG